MYGAFMAKRRTARTAATSQNQARRRAPDQNSERVPIGLVPAAKPGRISSSCLRLALMSVSAGCRARRFLRLGLAPREAPGLQLIDLALLRFDDRQRQVLDLRLR